MYSGYYYSPVPYEPFTPGAVPSLLAATLHRAIANVAASSVRRARLGVAGIESLAVLAEITALTFASVSLRYEG